MRRSRTQYVTLLAWFAALVSTADAWAAPAECADTAERAQQRRRRGQLIEARADLHECSRATCPRVVRDDCTAWEAELDAAIPTMSVVVKDASGGDVLDATVLVDGRALERGTSGRSLEQDPGEHRIRVERGNAPPVERTIVLHEGEKHRIVEVRLAAPEAPPPEAPAHGGGPPASAVVLGGIGVGALAGFAALALTGLSRYHALQDECGVVRTCSTTEIDRNRTQMWIADGLGVAGVVALGAAAWLWIDAPRARVALAPAPGGMAALGRF